MQYSTANKHIKHGRMTQNGWIETKSNIRRSQSVLSPTLLIVTLSAVIAFVWMVAQSI